MLVIIRLLGIITLVRIVFDLGRSIGAKEMEYRIKERQIQLAKIVKNVIEKSYYYDVLTDEEAFELIQGIDKVVNQK